MSARIRAALAAATLALLSFSPARAQQPSSATLFLGRQVYAEWCVPCHGPGPGTPGTAVLRERYGDTRPAVLAERDDLTREYLQTFVREGVGVMPPFRKTEITDAELDAMAEYLTDTSPR